MRTTSETNTATSDALNTGTDALEEVVIDVRSAACFAAGHLPGATHFTGPGGPGGPDGLSQRLAELPSPTRRAHMRARVVCDAAASGTACVSLLLSAGFGAAFSAVLDQTAQSSSSATLESGLYSRRLWRPSPLCLSALSLFPGTRGSALDVGAGGGRDAAFLAGQGWSVTAAERSSELIARGARLATRPYVGDVEPRGAVHGVTRTFGSDLRADRAWFRDHAAQLVLVIRFLRRGVLDLIPDAILPGGVIAYEHFLVGCETFGSPRKVAQMVRPGELAAVFSQERGFTVVKDVVETLDDGRPVNRFIAVRQLEEG